MWTTTGEVKTGPDLVRVGWAPTQTGHRAATESSLNQAKVGIKTHSAFSGLMPVLASSLNPGPGDF